MYKYKSKNGQDYFIPGYGRTQGGVITCDRRLENPNFELIEGPDKPAPNHVAAVAPQNTQPAQPVVAPEAPVEAVQPTQSNGGLQ